MRPTIRFSSFFCSARSAVARCSSRSCAAALSSSRPPCSTLACMAASFFCITSLACHAKHKETKAAKAMHWLRALNARAARATLEERSCARARACVRQGLFTSCEECLRRGDFLRHLLPARLLLLLLLELCLELSPLLLGRLVLCLCVRAYVRVCARAATQRTAHPAPQELRTADLSFFFSSALADASCFSCSFNSASSSRSRFFSTPTFTKQTERDC